MKFERRTPPPGQTSADAPACPDQPEPPPSQEPDDSSVRGRYGRAIDSALSPLAQLRAHAWEHHLAQEPTAHAPASHGSGTDGAEAVFRPERFSGRAGGKR